MTKKFSCSMNKHCTILRLFILLFTTISLTAQAQNQPQPITATIGLLNEMDSLYSIRLSDLKYALRSHANYRKYQNNIHEQIHLTFKAVDRDWFRHIPTATIQNDSTIKNKQFHRHTIYLDNDIPAHLYIPQPTKQKQPAILLLPGHEKEGKSATTYRLTAESFVNKGFIVLVPDPIGQGERTIIDSTTNKAIRATTLHTIMQHACIESGENLALFQLKENLHAVNFLSNLPFVDKNAIGVFGNSGGGTMATFLSAIDKRIKAVACCSWFTRRQNMYHRYGVDDGCQWWSNELKNKLEISDYYHVAVPRPLLILSGTKDFIDYQGTCLATEELRLAYQLFNLPENLTFFSNSSKHGIDNQKRETATDFFLKHLFSQNKNQTILSEIEIKQSLNNWPFQQTNSFVFVNKIPFPTPDTIGLSDSLIINRLKFHQIQNFKAKKIASTDKKFNTIQIDQGKYKKTLTFDISKNKKAKNAYIFITDQPSINTKTQLLLDSLSFDNQLIFTTLSGTENSKKDNDKSNPKFYSKDYSVAALSQMLGKNIVDTQVDELQKIIHYIKTNQKKKHIHLITEGRLCYLARLISLSKENPFETIIRINDTNFSPINLYHFPMKKEQATLVIMP